jgi:predicted CXXCH cytochrome family protein
VLYRARFIIGVLTVFLLFLGFFVSCNIDIDRNKFLVSSNEVERHKVLTFFFDGVPPLGGEEFDEGPIDANFPQARRRPETVWYIHEPAKTKKDCVRCHGNRLQMGFSREVQMTAKVPGLCYECHESLIPTAMEGWVHGPVSVGVCLFCHDPHRTQHQHLLKRPIPDLCFWCHEKKAIELIPDHSQEIYSKCNYCREGHVSPARFLLKQSIEEKAVEVEELDPKTEAEESVSEVEKPEPKTEVEEPELEVEFEEPESEAGASVQ